MEQERIQFSVFSKPWREPLPELGRRVSALGFVGVELPVRPGYQVEPASMAKDLPKAAKVLADYGVRIDTVASDFGIAIDEAMVAACAESNVRVLRILAKVEADGYLASEARLQGKIEALLPLLDKYNVTLGVQNHADKYICNAMGLRHLMERYDPRLVGAVWDPAHNALSGEDLDIALEIVWSHLLTVNLKNAIWQPKTGPEAEYAQWRKYWTGGRYGLASWPLVAAELKRRNYSGVVCLHAEYTDHAATDRLIVEDMAFARSLFAQ